MTENYQSQTSQFPNNFFWQKFSGEIQQSETEPTIERLNGKLIIPTFVYRDEMQNLYYYIPVSVDYKGQSYDNAEKCLKQCYAELRKHFYGDALFQRELECDGLLNKHITAVKVAFPKPNGTVVKIYSKYAIKQECEKLDLWDELKEAITTAGKEDSWNNIEYIRSDNTEFMEVLPMIRQMFPTVDVDEVLDKCLY